MKASAKTQRQRVHGAAPWEEGVHRAHRRGVGDRLSVLERREGVIALFVKIVRLGQKLGGIGVIRVYWTEAGKVRDLIRAVPEAALQKLRRLVTSGSRLNVQLLTNGGV